MEKAGEDIFIGSYNRILIWYKRKVGDDGFVICDTMEFEFPILAIQSVDIYNVLAFWTLT